MTRTCHMRNPMASQTVVAHAATSPAVLGEGRATLRIGGLPGGRLAMAAPGRARAGLALQRALCGARPPTGTLPALAPSRTSPLAGCPVCSSVHNTSQARCKLSLQLHSSQFNPSPVPPSPPPPGAGAAAAAASAASRRRRAKKERISAAHSSASTPRRTRMLGWKGCGRAGAAASCEAAAASPPLPLPLLLLNSPPLLLLLGLPSLLLPPGPPPQLLPASSDGRGSMAIQEPSAPSRVFRAP